MAAINISDEIADILDNYAEDVKEITSGIILKTAKDTADKLKSESPTSSGHTSYAKSWTVSNRGGSVIVHNRFHYHLTHLLEYGHVKANQYGTYSGRTSSFPHIAPAEKWAKEEVIERIKKAMQ